MRFILRGCLYFSFISERKVPKETPRETQGFTTSVPRFIAEEVDGIPRVDFCGGNFV